MTRKLQQPYLRKSDQACLIFLVTFWNYPARSKDKVRTNHHLKGVKKNKTPLKRGTRGINYLMRGKGKGYDGCTPIK